MAITDISISQDNKVSDSNLIPVHSPVIFIVDVTYTGLVPDTLNVELYDKDDVLIDTYKCIPYLDLLATLRQFIFIADEPIRSLMEGFDDFAQLNETFVPVPDITKVFKLNFVDPDNAATFDIETFVFVHGAEQFGNNPNLVDQFNNEDDNYFAPKDNFVYVYFYNNDAANNVSVGDEFLQLIPDELNVPIEGDTDNIVVNSNGTWLATESESWISLTTPSGIGDGNFGIITDANGTGLTRIGTVTVTQGVLINTVTVNQATNILTATYDYDLTINDKGFQTDKSGDQWRLVDILPADRDGCDIIVNLDYALDSGAGSVNNNASLYYGIGVNPTTEPSWVLIDSVNNGSSSTAIEPITIADGEYLFVRVVTGSNEPLFVGEYGECNVDLIDGSVTAPCSGTATASGTPLIWDNIKGTKV